MGGREGQGFVGQAVTPRKTRIAQQPRIEMEENGGADGRIGGECRDPHLAAKRGTE